MAQPVNRLSRRAGPVGLNPTHPRPGFWQATAHAMLGLVLGLTSCGSGIERDPDGQRWMPLQIDGRHFRLELAADPDSRYQGLSGRANIPDDQGMLFVFPHARKRQFVMRDCLVPIDIIFLDPAGRVLAMHEMQVEPKGTPESQLRRYGSRYPAQFAIELAGGTLDELELTQGQKIHLPRDRLVELAE